MPTYQYACTSCDDRLEVVQKFSDDPLTECAECGGRLRKLFSPVGIVFKGSGFYRTDSRSGPGTNGAKPKDGAASSPAKSDSSSSDAKPAAKAESSSDSTPSSSSASSSGTSSSSGSATSTKVA